MIRSRVKTCCTKCGDPIGNKFTMTTDYKMVLSKKPIFCDDCERLEFNDFCYISPNKQLAGPANPKTKIPPIVAPPIADLEYWKNNNLITHSHINSQSTQPLYESGFFPTTACDKKKCYIIDNLTCENYQQERINKNTITSVQDINNNEEVIEKLNPSQKNFLRSIDTKNRNINFAKDVDINIINNGNDVIQPITDVDKCCFPEDINITCGYNRQNPFRYGLPTNYAAANCEQSEKLKSFNDNLFTQTLQPGIYTKTQVNETPVSNIGISFAQPFEPVTVCKDNCGTTYTQLDPNLITNVIEPEPKYFEDPNIYNVYDPRCNGYGTSYRAYNDDLLGQTRFMYDDIDAIRNPNYISRNHIDHLSFGDTYGPMPPCGSEGNIYTGNIREMVNQSFTDSTNQFRSELQERLMRKNNIVAWQKRQAPISTGGFCAK